MSPLSQMDSNTIISGSASLVAVATAIGSWIGSRNKSNTKHVEQAIKEQIWQLQERWDKTLNDRLDKLDREYIDINSFDMRFKLLEQGISNIQKLFDMAIQQLDHRVTRNTDQISDLIGDRLERRRKEIQDKG